MKKIKLRCLATYDDNGQPMAFCLELCLIGFGESRQEALVDLYDKIDEYLEEAETVDYSFKKSLIPRRAPLYFYFVYYKAVLGNFFKKNPNITIETLSFKY